MSNRLQALQKLFEESPNDPFLLFAMAKEYEKLNDNKLALQLYQQLVQEHTDYVGTYYHLGKLFEKSEKWEEALKAYEQGMEVAKKVGDRHALGELAGARLNLEDLF